MELLIKHIRINLDSWSLYDRVRMLLWEEIEAPPSECENDK